MEFGPWRPLRAVLLSPVVSRHNFKLHHYPRWCSLVNLSQVNTPSATNCGENLELGMVERLADGFLFCFFLAKLSVLSLDLAGTVKSFPNLFVYLLELV